MTESNLTTLSFTTVDKKSGNISSDCRRYIVFTDTPVQKNADMGFDLRPRQTNIIVSPDKLQHRAPRRHTIIFEACIPVQTGRQLTEFSIVNSNSPYGIH